MHKAIKWVIVRVGIVAGVVALVAVCAALPVLRSFGVIPPLYLPRSSVLVQCHLPAPAPDGSGFYFIKSVTQQRSKARFITVVAGGWWVMDDVPVWTKAYLFFVDRKGEKKCIVELPADLFNFAPYDGPWRYRIVGFKTSASLKRAIVLAPLMKLVVVDWEKKACYPYDLSSHPGVSLSSIPLDISPDGTEFIFSSNGKDSGMAICDFDGHIRVFPTEQPPTMLNWDQNKDFIVMRFPGYFQIFDPHSLKVSVDSRMLDSKVMKTEFEWVRDLPPCYSVDGLLLNPQFLMGEGGECRLAEGSKELLLKAYVLHRNRRIEKEAAVSFW